MPGVKGFYNAKLGEQKQGIAVVVTIAAKAAGFWLLEPVWGVGGANWWTEFCAGRRPALAAVHSIAALVEDGIEDAREIAEFSPLVSRVLPGDSVQIAKGDRIEAGVVHHHGRISKEVKIRTSPSRASIETIFADGLSFVVLDGKLIAAGVHDKEKWTKLKSGMSDEEVKTVLMT